MIEIRFDPGFARRRPRRGAPSESALQQWDTALDVTYQHGS